MAYGRLPSCPADHPVAVPRLTLHVRGTRHFRPRGRLTCERIDQHHVRRLFQRMDERTASLASKCLNAKVQVGATGPATG